MMENILTLYKNILDWLLEDIPCLLIYLSLRL